MEIQYQEIIDFIRKVYNKPEGVIPLHAPVFNGKEKQYLEECIDSTFVSSVGKYVDLFEKKIELYTGSKKAVACVNGTSALHLALKLVGVSEDSEVITQALTFVATANAITYCNAQPIFVDVDRDCLGLSAQALLKFLENNTYVDSNGHLINKRSKKQISACLPMHTFGHPCKIDEIAEICQNYNIPVVEDAAESLGSRYKGQHTGTFGKIGVLSFNGNKILTTGGGGMLLIQDEELGKRAKHLSTQAKLPHEWKFIHDETGYNYRLPNINAALGLAQMEQLEEFLSYKRHLAIQYKNLFEQTSIEFINEPPFATSNYWLNSILFENRHERDEFLKFSNGEGVMTRPVWQLMSELPLFKYCQTDELQTSIMIADRLVNIPSSVLR